MHLEWFGISATIKSLLCPQIYIWVAVAPGTVGRGCKAVLSKYICPAPGSFLCHIKKGVMQAERQLSGRAISVPKWAAALGSIPYTGDWGSTVLRDRGRIWPPMCVFPAEGRPAELGQGSGFSSVPFRTSCWRVPLLWERHNQGGIQHFCARG